MSTDSLGAPGRFVDIYKGTPPWDIGRCQADLTAAFDELEISGSVIDLGCGTGEHVIELARRGLEAVGIDSTPRAPASTCDRPSRLCYCDGPDREKAPMHLITPPSFNVTQLFELWKRLKHLPGGKLLFSKLVGRVAPYTGTIDARIEELRPRYARLSMKDRPAVRNHLSSIHALALANFAEETTGLAMLAGFPEATRGIITNLSIDYVKKARGTLTAECRAPRVESNAPAEHLVSTEIKNAEGQVVARATITWRIGPTR